MLFALWRNLLYADRYMMLLRGLAITVQAALGALVLGILLGFLTALMKLSPLKVKITQKKNFYPLRSIASLYTTIVRGIPMVVQLMIMYFIVFVSIDNTLQIRTPQLLIAVIAFGINSGAYVSEIFRASILSVDHGQTEAGRSVGLSSVQTMRLIILPQAFKNALPTLCNEFILLFKETAIVGYIGMADLTKAGDIIRSRTYSAFIPLLTVAIVYLVIVIILTWIFGKLERRLRKGDSR
ncbi:MAG: amino acid ABC transporter permease [Oscillospiraceae bacterium]|nr:amino acid ABC transporter permease [Oscillospiraceae bacterium]